jgi:hypothetical protein
VTEASRSNTIARLTALWALSESGLGGLMHALRIPFTGFFVGGFAIIIISLLAYYSGYKMKTILQSTALVLLVKFAVSPQSPLPAYIAVGFQGLYGALLFAALRNFTIAPALFGCIALLESAVQKFLLTTILFGKSVWEALDAFVQSVLKDFGLGSDFSFSFWLISIYTAVYFIWGILLGIWVSRLPKRIDAETESILNQYKASSVTLMQTSTSKKHKWKLLSVFFVLFFIVIVLLMQGTDVGAKKALYVVMRTIAVLLFLLYIINPLLQFLLSKWKGKHQQAVEELVKQLPALRDLVQAAYALSAMNRKGLRRYSRFVFLLIVLSVFAEHENP